MACSVHLLWTEALQILSFIITLRRRTQVLHQAARHIDRLVF